MADDVSVVKVGDAPKAYQLADLHAGVTEEFEVTVSAELVDRFAALSGDINPLHVDGTGAQERGFPTRVAHGALMCAFASRLIGMYLPGERSLLHSLNMTFRKPVLVGETIRIRGHVEHVIEGARTIVVGIVIEGEHPGDVRSSGRAQVGVVDGPRRTR